MSPRDFPTPTELKILEILFAVTGGLYGLQIVEQGISRGSVYVLLSRLAAKGYVQMKNRPDAEGYMRPHYRVTPNGEEVVKVANRIHLRPQGA